VRLAFIALLCLNLAYFAWANWVDAPRPAPVNESITRLPRLKLVEEVPPAERPQAQTAQKTSLTPAAACLSVGPFADEHSGARAAALLKTKGFEPRQRAEQGPVTQNYWVYVSGLSQSEADAALVALERSGIPDARVVPESGPAGWRVSLGIYSERARAERRAEAVRQSGLEAEIAERKLAVTAYWIDLAAPAGIDAGAVPVKDLPADRSNSRIGVQPCPAPATPAPAVTINSSATRSAPGRVATAVDPAGMSAQRAKLH
jgi:hypothetical protein